jgi:hypothetical protein
MGWREDAMTVLFAHQKNDPEGNRRPKDPRHVYPNPLIPAICPVLSLGIYLLCTAFQPNQTHLFPGNSQYDRYHKALQTLMKTPDVVRALKHAGVKAADIGTHSVRKGAASYCSGGQETGPQMPAIQLRAGWTLGSVQDCYIRYEAAGDQVVGRTVAGLPHLNVNFAILPPFFRTHSDVLDTAISDCFPGAPANLHRVLESCIASVLYHSEFLRATLKAEHRLFTTPLFTRPEYFALRTEVVSRLYEIGDPIQPTGTPLALFALAHG